MTNPNITLVKSSQEGSEYFLIDPSSHEQLEGIPEVLYDFPEFSQGITFLQDHASEISSDLYLARHVDMNDLGGQHDFENVLSAKKYGAVFLENQYWRAEDQVMLQKYTSRQISLQAFTERFSNTHALRSVMAIETGTPVYFADIPNETESEAGEFFREARKMAGVSSKTEVGDLTETEMLGEANFAAYQNLREWYSVGMMGYDLESQYHDLPIEVLVSYGIAHEGIGKKLTSLGVDVARVDPHENVAHHPASLRIMGAIATGRYAN